jgi:hypothetical protein
MATFWQILSIENRNKLATFYEEKFGQPFLPPERHEERVRLQGKLENLDEIDKLMRQKPSGRMGRE